MLCFLLLLFLCLPAWAYAAGNEPINPLPVDEFNQPTADFYQDLRTFLNDEMPGRDKENKLSYAVVQGGSHPVSASMTSIAFSTIAYTNWQQRVNQPPASINYAAMGCNADDTGWVIISAQSANTLAQFTRVPGTEYFVDCTSTIQPALPDNSAWLMRVVIASSAVTTVESIGNIVVASDSVFTVTANLTTNAQTQWYIAPGGRVRVAPGVTLTLGACPNAGMYPIFEAMGNATSGVVRFTENACHHVWAEWWGADPTGVVDSTLIWREALVAARLSTTPVWCAGVYRISATETNAFPTNQALTLVGFEQIIGNYTQIGSSGPGRGCRFEFYGTGRAIGTTSGTENKPFILLKNIQIRDVENTGSRGLDLTAVRAGSFYNVVVLGFDMGMWLGTLYYYSEMRQIKISDSRTFCADMSGSALNGVFIEIDCNTDSPTLDTGIRIGSAPGLYGTGRSMVLKSVIENYSGVALSVARHNNFRGDVYIEQYGDPVDHNPLGAVTLSRMRGGELNLSASVSIVGAELPVGVRIIATNDTVAMRQFKITGHLNGYTMPVRIDGGAGAWGYDITQLKVESNKTNHIGNYTSGFLLGGNLVSAGPSPVQNIGRGNDATDANNPAEVWKQGDLIWGVSGNNPGVLTNLVRIVNADGNPPAGISTMILPTLSVGTAVVDDTTPSVKINQLYMTRMNLSSGAGDITMLDDGIAGQCVWLRSLGTRTIVHAATGGIKLNPPTNWAMTTDDVLYLCFDNNYWREYSRTDYP